MTFGIVSSFQKNLGFFEIGQKEGAQGKDLKSFSIFQ